MEEKALAEGARFLHVANGTSTTRTIEAAGIPGQVSIWADPLHEGPVPGGLDDTELLEVRRRYLAGDSPSVDPVNDLRRWRAVIERHESYDELVLWFEHDLFDQLNLIQLLTWIRKRVPAAKPVSLISIGSFPGRPNFKGLGELTPGELARKVEPTLRSIDPMYFSQSIDPTRVLLVEAAQDSFVPAHARLLHWEALGRPRIIRIDYDHKVAFLLSMTFLSRHFTARAIAEFFDETL